MIIHARAPVRLDFAGGWTDVAPFATEERGAVVNAAIDLHAEVRIELGGDGYRLESTELGQVVEARDPSELEKDGRLDLIKAAVRMYAPGPCRVTTRSEAPPGSGLGSSGAMDVALVAAFEAAAGRSPGAAELAERAWELEAVEARLPGGKQDQYGAAFGGWNALAFDGRAGDHEASRWVGSTAVRRAVELPAGFAEHLADRILVCYTGRSRISGDTIARVMTRFVLRDPVVTATLHELATVADEMARALEAGDPGAIGTLLGRNWALQQRLDAGMRTPEMAALEAAMLRAGALGGKAAGAGAGGTMFFLFDRPASLAAGAARAAGATVLPLRWAAEGVKVW